MADKKVQTQVSLKQPKAASIDEATKDSAKHASVGEGSMDSTKATDVPKAAEGKQDGATTPETKPAANAAESKPTLTPQEPAPKGFAGKIHTLKKTGTPQQKSVIDQMTQYLENMAPGQYQSPQTLVQNQLLLYSVIRHVLDSETEFHTCYPLLVDYFREYKDTTLNERYLHRGVEYLPLDKDTLALFQGVLNAIIAIVDRGTPQQAAKIIDINRTFKEGILSDATRERIISYYS